jgi:starch synthase
MSPESPDNQRDWHLLMIAAENDALPGGKVGGVGDVVRDIAPALAQQGCRVTTLVPSHGFLHHRSGAERTGEVAFRFRSEMHSAEIYTVVDEATGTHHLIFHHELFSVAEPGTGLFRLYFNDPDDMPFATDANKFAAFCSAIASWLLGGAATAFDLLHLHDWHTGYLLALIQADPNFAALQSLPTVFSIHNLQLQGIRPYEADLKSTDSAFHQWYPWLKLSDTQKEELADPRWTHCMNPMAVGIRFADRVHTVSPTYADEILEPTDESRGFIGGEGLENLLQQRMSKQALVGILNGCSYTDFPARDTTPEARYQQLVSTVRHTLETWTQLTPARVHELAWRNLEQLENSSPRLVVTAVSRIVAQKVALLFEHPQTTHSENPTVVNLLNMLGDNGVFIFLGSGLRVWERKLQQLAEQHENFIFLNGFSAECADVLYQTGDLFLMPSSFEPCGISQMMALRGGQPVLAHAVGGLKDTIIDGANGFCFKGESEPEQAEQLQVCFHRALNHLTQVPEGKQQFRQAALASRFLWSDSAEDYCQQLYVPLLEK